MIESLTNEGGFMKNKSGKEIRKLMQKYETAILEIFSQYDGFYESYLITKGLELVGIDNYNFWKNVITYIERYKGFETLPIYIDIMEKIGRKDLILLIESIKSNKKYINIEIMSNKFVATLTEINLSINDCYKKTI